MESAGPKGKDAGLGYRALLVDIDGTLLGDGDELTDRTRTTLARVRERGLLVFLATGRSIHGALKIHQELQLDTPLICYNGLVIFEPRTGEWLRHHRIPDELVPELIEVARRYASFFFLFHQDKKFSLPFGSSVHRKMAETLKNVETVELEDLPQKEVTKLNLYCDPQGSEAVRGFLSRASETVQVDVFPLSAIAAFKSLDLMYLDVQPVHDGKAQALGFLRERYGIPPSAVIAFGDQVNDKPMLLSAGLGVAVANAPPSLKRIATLVIDSNRKDGVAKFLDVLYPC